MADHNEQHPALSLDTVAFLAAAVVGAAVIWGFKPLGVPQWVVTTVVSLLVLGYAVLMALVPRLHLRLDQAGDNAYYLGLVYTLTSMTRALWEVGQAAATPDGQGIGVAEGVIGDFGIALMSTLMGIVCRLVLQQMRTDPADVEKSARLELAMAASRMRDKLQSITTEFGEFHEGLRQKHSDYVRELQAGYKALADESAAQLVATTADTATRLRDSGSTVALAISNSAHEITRASEQVVSATERFSAAPDKAARAVEEAADRLARIVLPPELASVRFIELASGLQAVAKRVTDFGGELAAGVEQLSLAGTSLQNAMGEMETTIGRARAREAGRDELLQQFGSAHQAQLDAMQQSISTIGDTVAALSLQAAESQAALGLTEASARKTLDGLSAVVTQIAERLDRTPT